MHLKTLEYSEFPGRERAWEISGLSFGQVNLLVGKNSSGKSRTLNLIANLSKRLQPSTEVPKETGYVATFDNDGSTVEYVLRIRDGVLEEESVSVDGSILLDRDSARMEIFAYEMQEFLSFSPPANEIAASSRRDAIQHPFLMPLSEWASAVRHYHFGASLGQFKLAVERKSGPSLDDKNEDLAVPIFIEGKKRFGSTYTDAVTEDMRKLGYDVSNVDVATPWNYALVEPYEGTLLAISLEERGVIGRVFQTEMSQGMFRALSILSQIHYSQLAQTASCILIDDIGEGLDFERSAKLIEILRDTARKSAFQLIMTTNDQFVMNHVPLEEWSVLQRTGGVVSVKNYENSRAAFEYFRFVGMSNFAFFELDFANAVPDESQAAVSGEN